MFPGEEFDPNASREAWESWGHYDFKTYFYDAAAEDGDETVSLSPAAVEEMADLVEAEGDLLRWEYTSAEVGVFPDIEKAGHRAYALYKESK